MTERLSQLMHDEAAYVEVPAPLTGKIIVDGRRRRRRTRAGMAAMGTAAATVLAVGSWAVFADNPRHVDAAALESFETWGAVAAGRDLMIGDVEIRWDDDITAMYYTSLGVVVRSSGDYSLIRADGEVSTISVDIPDRVPGFEPDSTRFAYAEPLDEDQWEVVVHDAASDEELARVEVAGRAYGGWTAPPVAIDGDRAWVHLAGGWVEVEWRSGMVHEVPNTENTYELANGVYAVQSGPNAEGLRRPWEIRSWAGGELVRTVDLPRDWYAFFSPDGRYLRAFSQGDDAETAPLRIYDTLTGEFRDLPDGDVGWTPDGDVLHVSQDEIRVCPPLGGECRGRPFDRGAGGLRIGGNPYES